MRAGKLDTQASLLSPQGAVLSTELIGIDDRETAPNYDPQLIGPANVKIRARWQSAIVAGGYFAALDGRLWLITNVVNPDGKQLDALCAASVVGGQAVTVTTAEGDVQTRVAMLGYVPAPAGDHNYLAPTEPQRQAEFVNCEYIPKVNDEFTASGALYRITQLDHSQSTAVSTRAWVQFLQYV